MASVSMSYARIADRYERARGGDGRAKVFAPALDEWLPKSGRICDVGCGTCVVTERLQGPGRQVVGCDLSLEMLSNGGRRLAGRRAQADAEALPFPASSLDGLSYMWVLHHVGQLAVALAEARRVLRAGGRLVTISGTSLPTGDDMGPIFDSLTDRFRPGRRDLGLDLGQAAIDEGFTVVHDSVVTAASASSPNELADAVEDRLFSFAWDLTDDQWNEEVEPAVAALRSLPGPDRQRERVFRHPLVVLERPTS